MERTSEPVKGLFGKVMEEISERAREWRAQGSIGTVKPPNTSELSPERKATLRGLPPMKWGTTFDAFDLSQCPRMKAPYDAAVDFAGGTWKPWCLVLSGPYGTGKTHLAYAVANYRREKGLPYRMITAPGLMSQLKSSIDEKRRSVETMAPLAYGPEEWVKSFSEAAFLIIDDFGAQQDTEWATAQLFAILNARYDANRPTLITTNLSVGQFDPRIASRIRAGLLMCVGEDQRARYDR